MDPGSTPQGVHAVTLISWHTCHQVVTPHFQYSSTMHRSRDELDRLKSKVGEINMNGEFDVGAGPVLWRGVGVC
jgi:hypothetical protein